MVRGLRRRDERHRDERDKAKGSKHRGGVLLRGRFYSGATGTMTRVESAHADSRRRSPSCSLVALTAQAPKDFTGSHLGYHDVRRDKAGRLVPWFAEDEGVVVRPRPASDVALLA